MKTDLRRGYSRGAKWVWRNGGEVDLQPRKLHEIAVEKAMRVSSPIWVLRVSVQDALVEN